MSMKMIIVVFTVIVSCFLWNSEATCKDIPVFDSAVIAAGKTGGRSVSSGKALAASVQAGKIADTECAVFTVVPGKADAKDAWAALGFQFSPPGSMRPIGMRWKLVVPEELSLTVEAKHNGDAVKGFWNSNRIGGTRTFQLKKGEQVLDVYWKELGISDTAATQVNAGVLVLNIPAKLGIVSFALLVPESDDAAGREVVVYDPGMIRDNPVARPNDAMLMGLHGFAAGKGFRSRTEPLENDGVTAIRWVVDGPEGQKSWATFGIGMTDMLEPGLEGLVFDIDVSRPVRVEIQPHMNFNRHKGFYGTTKVGQRRYLDLNAGRQRLLVDWGMFAVPDDVRSRVNAVMFSMSTPGDSIDFYGMNRVFPSAEAAAQQRAAEAGSLEKAQSVMIQALKERHVDWQSALMKLSAAAREPLIWDGVMLAAQREQLNYFSHMGKGSEPMIRDNAALVQAGAAGDFKDMRERAQNLQTRIDSWIDGILSSVPAKQRKFSYDEQTRVFRYPDGRLYRMFGPHFFRSIYFDNELLYWRKWDLRYLAGLGFNGIRLHIVWRQLEPERGKFNLGYLQMLKNICAEAERYGLGVSVDLHWPYPDWFVAGNPEMKPKATASRQNSYHWPEALVESWRLIGREFADVPNIVAFEVPTNETPIGNDPDGMMRYPSLLARWNSFLRQKYQTREALVQAWAGSEELQDHENWDENSILPLGFRNPGMTAEEVFENSPRFYDHLQFCADLQKQVSGDIVAALRESIPDAYGMFQRTIGDMWDKSPVPVDYNSIITSVGKHVIPGTHYNMGGVQARKTSVLSQGSYDSEQQMENNSAAVKAHVKSGGGFCPFAFHFYGGGGMLLADNGWHLKQEIAYLPEMADWIRSSVPEQKQGTPVAVIVNSRLEASTGHQLGDLIAQLEKRDCRVGVFESLRIMDEPSLLDGYRLAITNSGYLDTDLLKLLQEKFPGVVLLTGRLDRDAYARSGAAGLPGYLTSKRIFLKESKLPQIAGLSGNLDLTGNWDFCFQGKNEAAPEKVPEKLSPVESMKVPGQWGETGMTGSLQFRIGDGWYMRDVVIPQDWKGRPLTLRIGAIDDVDWVFLNGKLIGHTGEDQANYWVRAREYSLPEENIRWGKPNQLRILVRNLRDDGGIWKGPVEISGRSGVSYTAMDGSVRTSVACGNNAALLPRHLLVNDAEVLAELSLPDDPEKYAALLRQEKLLWFFGDQEFDGANPAFRHALETALALAND